MISTLKKKILVIDDEPDIALMVKSRLESNGYDVDIAYSGEEALKRAEHENFDLYVLDVILPGISGYEVCVKLKTDRAVAAPVVMLTSRSKVVDEHLGFACKADAYVRKPLSGELLLPEIKKLLHQTEG